MARRLPGGPATNYRTTDHSEELGVLRAKLTDTEAPSIESLSILVAIDLLQGHDDTGLSLDHWQPARRLVEWHLGWPIMENGV